MREYQRATRSCFRNPEFSRGTRRCICIYSHIRTKANVVIRERSNHWNRCHVQLELFAWIFRDRNFKYCMFWRMWMRIMDIFIINARKLNKLIKKSQLFAFKSNDTFIKRKGSWGFQIIKENCLCSSVKIISEESKRQKANQENPTKVSTKIEEAKVLHLQRIMMIMRTITRTTRKLRLWHEYHHYEVWLSSNRGLSELKPVR